ncbi:MAG TPA: glycoside hydrolase family 2 protein, partial [Gemmatimonadaceae bacterium]
GWGVVDAAMRPKAAYYIAGRAMQPIAATISDEGNNGLCVSIANDCNAPFAGDVTVALVRGPSTVVAQGTASVGIDARGTSTVEIDALLGRFYDPAYAFRFGPPGHDIVVATVRDAAGEVVSEDFHFPLGHPSEMVDELDLSCEARSIGDGVVEISLRASEFVQSLWLDCGDYRPEDNYFHMGPGSKRIVIARAKDADATFHGFAQPLNAREGVRISVVADATPARAISNVGART